MDHSTLNLPELWLRPLKLRGGRQLPNRILPGPMEGIAHEPFCSVMTRLQLVDCWIAPFIRVSKGVPRTKKLRQALDYFFASNLPLVVQLMGTDINMLAGTAERLDSLGVVGVDLNCACPSPIVIGNGGGGARLRDPQWIHDAIIAVSERCSCAVSVKLRTGFADWRESEKILPAVAAARPDFVMLHHRTVAEMYRPIVGGYERLPAARQMLPDLPLIGSGDLFTPRDAARMYEIAGVDGIAPARGLLRDPWLLQTLKKCCSAEEAASVPTPGADKMEFLRQIAAVAEHTGVKPHGFLIQLAKFLFGRDSTEWDQIKTRKSIAEIRQWLESELP